jgi:hypothetical protein
MDDNNMPVADETCDLETRVAELERMVQQLTELARLQAARLDKIEAEAKADADLAIKLALPGAGR